MSSIFFDLRRPQVFALNCYIVDCVVQARIYRSSISLDLRRSLELPRRRFTSDRWISCAFRCTSPNSWNTRSFWIPALSSTCVSLQVFPRFSPICGIKPRYPASFTRDLPRIRSPASFTPELHYYCVLLCRLT